MTLTEEQIAEIRARAERDYREWDSSENLQRLEDMKSLLSALEAANKRADEAEAQLVIVRRQRDDMNAAYQFECKAAREREAAAISADECATAILALTSEGVDQNG